MRTHNDLGRRRFGASDGTASGWDAGSGPFLYDNRGRMQAAPAPYHLAEARYTDEGLPHTLQPGTLLLSQDYRQLSGPWRRDFSNQYRTRDEARVGRYSWAVESDTGCENGCQYMISTDVTDEAAEHPGATIVFSAWAKGQPNHENVNIQFKYKAGGEWHYPAYDAKDYYDAGGQWQRLEVRLDLSTITDLQHITPIARHTGTKGVPAYFDDLRVYAVGGSGDAPSGAEIRYRYTAGGQRTYTQVGTGAPTFTVRGGAAALGQLRGPASSGGDPAVDYWNVLLPSGTPIGRFVDGSANDRRYYHTDHLGSTRAVTDGSGQVVERRDHYPFGLQMPGRTLAQGPQANEDYTGHALDEETGLHYAGARFYMSALGRWGTTDPLADDFPARSSYNYVQNNPLSLLDPDGRAPMDWYKDREGRVKYDQDVQSQDDLDDGQEYLGESVLARSEDGGAQVLEADGSVSTVFEGGPNGWETFANILTGFSGATSKAQWTLEMAGEAGETLARRNSVVATGLSVAGVVTGTAGRESDSVTYQTLMGGADFAILGIGTLGPKGTAASLALDLFVKEPAVEWATTGILSLQVDRTIDVERPVNGEEARQ